MELFVAVARAARKIRQNSEGRTSDSDPGWFFCSFWQQLFSPVVLSRSRDLDGIQEDDIFII